MLAAVKAAGGCLDVSSSVPGMRWVVPTPDGGIQRFPEPVGHRLIALGLLCRHPGDVPGEPARYVRFVPRECLPVDYQGPEIRLNDLKMTMTPASTAIVRRRESRAAYYRARRAERRAVAARIAA